MYSDKKKGLYLCSDIDLHPFSWTDIIKLLFENEFGILPDSFLLIIVFRLVRDVVANH